MTGSIEKRIFFCTLWRHHCRCHVGRNAKRRILSLFDRVDTKSNLVDGLSRGRVEGPWSEAVLGRLLAELTKRLRCVVFDHCQPSGGCSIGLAWTFRGGCEAVCSACFAEAVQDIPAAQMRESGKECCVSFVILIFVPSHTQGACVTCC